MRAILLSCFLGLGLLGAGCASPGESRAEAWARSRPPIGPSVDLLARGDALLAEQKYLEAKRTYATAAEADGPASAYVEACAQVARVCALTGQPGQGEPWLRMAVARMRPEEPLGWSRVQHVLAIFERAEGLAADADVRLTRLYDYCFDHRLFDRAVDVAHQMVLSSADEADQLRWSKKAIAAAEEGGLHRWLAARWHEMAVALEAQGREEEALLAAREAKSYGDLGGTEAERLAGDWAVGRLLRKTGRLEEALEVSRRVLPWAARRHAADPGPQETEWLGYAKWERAELDWLCSSYGVALTGLEEAREALVAAGLEARGKAGQETLAGLDARIRQLEKEMP